jgi:hypothetical protein
MSQTSRRYLLQNQGAGETAADQAGLYSWLDVPGFGKPLKRETQSK